jgi:hypothetical protein
MAGEDGYVRACNGAQATWHGQAVHDCGAIVEKVVIVVALLNLVETTACDDDGQQRRWRYWSELRLK